MNPATYKNLNGEPIDVTISAAARRWIHEEYTSLRTYAETQVQRHKDGLSLDHGVTVVDRRFETAADKRTCGDGETVGSAASQRKSCAGSQPADREHSPARPTAQPPSDPVAGDEWPRWLKSVHFDCIGCHKDEVTSMWYEHRGVARSGRMKYSRNIVDADPIAPTEAAEWLRSHGHESVADEIDGIPPELREARVFKNGDWLFVNLAKRVGFGRPGPVANWRPDKSNPDNLSMFTEITNTPEAQAALCGLAASDAWKNREAK